MKTISRGLETVPTPRPPVLPSKVALSLANETDRETIYRLRHEIYAAELHQHAVNTEGRLRDSLDESNHYLVAREAGKIIGFISITPPRRQGFSIDKYFARDALPFSLDARTYEVRLLTVLKPHRGRELAMLLMYAAFRWVESHGGDRIVAIGRRAILDLYLRVGFRKVGLSAESGAVTYDLLTATLAELSTGLEEFSGLLTRLEQDTDWQLNVHFRKPAACFHGGAFFSAIGERFDDLIRRKQIINADVLDAWFPPARGVVTALQDHLPWLLATSPPTGCDGLIQEIAQARSVLPENILTGGGSSDLIFRAFRHWLTPASNVLILEPTYGEYAHVLERVIGCTVDRLTLERTNDYKVDLNRLKAALAEGYDLVVLVNPNSPTGQHIPRSELQLLLQPAPLHTRIWIDETYVEYAESSGRFDEPSLEKFAAESENIIVCKSMSKVYALSGARVAYLCAGPHQLEALRSITPPWVVSLPAQLAAVRALQDPAYYAARYHETKLLRESLTRELQALDWEVLPGIANFLLCHLPGDGPLAAELVSRCRNQGLFLRDAALMGRNLGAHAVRIAVKDAAKNARMLEIIRGVISD